MRIKPLPPLDYLKEAFTYDPETGIMRWKIRAGPRIKIGDIIGCADSRGHLQVNTKFGYFFVHRIIWFLMTEIDPGEMQVDHENTIRDDNRWVNLRLATHNHNAQNANKRCDNTSGIKGVCWHGKVGKWMGRVMYNKKTHRTAYYSDVKECGKAVQELREFLHKNFTHHGE